MSAPKPEIAEEGSIAGPIVIEDGPPPQEPPTDGSEDGTTTGGTTTDVASLQAQISAQQAQITAQQAQIATLQAQVAALSGQNNVLRTQITRISLVEQELASLKKQVDPLLMTYPLSTIGEAVVQAVESSELSLSAVGDGHGYTVADVECDVKGYVSLSQNGQVISLRPVQAAGLRAGETLSVVRFRASKLPAAAD